MCRSAIVANFDKTFSYLRDRVGGYEKPLWNCQQVKRAPPGQCMRTQVLVTPSAVITPPLLMLVSWERAATARSGDQRVTGSPTTMSTE